MRILVTGAAGFIGSHALRFFYDGIPGAEFVVLDRLTYAASLDRIAWARGDPRVKFVLQDLRAAVGDRADGQIGLVDYVVHFAAETHVDRSMVDPLPFLESNVVGTYNLLEYCRLSQPHLKMFFQVSTDEVYGAAADGIDHPEDAPHRPSNPYSATKAAAEDLVFAWNHSMGVPAIITNTMNNIGETQHPEKYLPKIIRCLLNRGMISVHGSPDEPGTRKYLHARDHASAIAFLMVHGRRGEKYNVVGVEEISNLDLVRRVEKIMKAEGLIDPDSEARLKFVDFHSTRPGHDRRYSLSGKKMELLGWTPPTKIDDALTEIVRWTMISSWQ